MPRPNTLIEPNESTSAKFKTLLGDILSATGQWVACGLTESFTSASCKSPTAAAMMDP